MQSTKTPLWMLLVPLALSAAIGGIIGGVLVGAISTARTSQHQPDAGQQAQQPPDATDDSVAELIKRVDVVEKKLKRHRTEIVMLAGGLDEAVGNKTWVSARGEVRGFSYRNNVDSNLPK